MNTWTSSSGNVFVLAQVEMVATGPDHPGAAVGGQWYPLSQAEAKNLVTATDEYYDITREAS